MQTSLEDYLAGARSAHAIAISGAFFGLLYGAACISYGISAPMAVLSSLLVFSGAVQFASLGLLDEPQYLIAIALSSLLISNRLILMAAAVAPHLGTRSPIERLASLHTVTDGSWAAVVGAIDRKDRNKIMVGAGLWVLLLWALGTLLGSWAASFADPTALKAFRYFGVIFLLLLLLMVVRTTRISHVPWLVAAITSCLSSLIFGISLSFIIGVSVGGFLAWHLDTISSELGQ